MPTVSGHVTTPDGIPLSGVWVYAHSGRGRVAGHTGRDGRWALTLPAGTWTVREVGHGRYDVPVGDDDVDVTTLRSAGTGEGPSAAPSREDVATLLARRRDGR